jgi:large subunit ribosomal protein L29
MGIKELREMGVEELKKELLELRREEFNLRMQKGMEEGPKPHQFSQVRRSVARIKTLIKEMGEK